MAKYFCKLYTKALGDATLARLSDRLYRRFIELLLFATEIDDDGQLPGVADMAWRLRCDDAQLDAEMAELGAAGLLNRIDSEWLITNWAKYQAPVSGAERVKQHRLRKKEEEKKRKEKSIYRVERYTNVTNALHFDNETLQEAENGVEKPDDNAYTDMIAAVSGTVKNVYADHINGAEFDNVCYALIGLDITPEQVKAFGPWWKENGYYTGKPGLKSLINEIGNSLDASAPVAGEYQEIDYGTLE